MSRFVACPSEFVLTMKMNFWTCLVSPKDCVINNNEVIDALIA